MEYLGIGLVYLSFCLVIIFAIKYDYEITLIIFILLVLFYDPKTKSKMLTAHKENKTTKQCLEVGK